MTSLLTVTGLVALAVIALSYWAGYRHGKRKERARSAEETLDNAEAARRARTDPDALERVRGKYRY